MSLVPQLFIHVGCNVCLNTQDAPVLRETVNADGTADYLTGSGAHYCDACDSSDTTWLGAYERMIPCPHVHRDTQRAEADTNTPGGTWCEDCGEDITELVRQQADDRY